MLKNFNKCFLFALLKISKRKKYKKKLAGNQPFRVGCDTSKYKYP